MEVIQKNDVLDISLFIRAPREPGLFVLYSVAQNMITSRAKKDCNFLPQTVTLDDHLRTFKVQEIPKHLFYDPISI